MLIFQNTLPSLGVGRLKLRGDDSRVYGTDKEYGLRLPDDPFYKQMAAEFSKYQISTNVYAFSDKYTDIASLVKYLQFLQLLRGIDIYDDSMLTVLFYDGLPHFLCFLFLFQKLIFIKFP